MRIAHRGILLAGLMLGGLLPALGDSPCATDDKLYTVTPCAAAPGATTKIVIRRDTSHSDTTDSTYSLKCATVDPQGSKVSITGPDATQDKFWTGSIEVDAAAPVGSNFLLLKIYPKTSCPDAAKTPAATPAPLQEILPFSINSMPPPGATPTAQPQVDIAWKVLPRTVTSDNFGARIAKTYYAIVVYLGNNAGYDLQLAGIYFKLPEAAGLQAPIPTDPYRVVRSTLEHEQVVGLRNTTINIVKGIGPILTGATPFFSGASVAAKNHKSNFQGFINLFSNPFEKGLEAIFPDLTVNQLVALDNQALRDSVIVSNNTAVPLLVFVDKDLFARVHPSDTTAATPKAQARTAYADKLRSKQKYLRSSTKSDHDPLLVMQELGELTLVGKYVQYSDRITLTGKAGTSIQPALPASAKATATAGTPQTAAVSSAFATALQVTVTDGTGSPVSGAQVVFAAPAAGSASALLAATGSGAAGAATATATTNSSGVASVTATANATAGSYSVTATAAGIATAATFALTNQ